jgi:beta-glucosidase
VAVWTAHPGRDRYGGWRSVETAKAFADYPGYVAEQLGGAPGLRLSDSELKQVRHHTDAYLAEAGGENPKFTDDELKTIASPLDFVGINVYRPGWYVEPSDEPPGYREIPINASHPKMQSAWHVLDPEVM